MSGFDLNSDAFPGDPADGAHDAGVTELKVEGAGDINGCFWDACAVGDDDDRIKDNLSREGLKCLDCSVEVCVHGRNEEKEANEETEIYCGNHEGDKEINNSSDKVRCAKARSFVAGKNLADASVELKAVDFAVSLSNEDQDVGTIESEKAMRLDSAATETEEHDETYNDQVSNVSVSIPGSGAPHGSVCETAAVSFPLNFDPCDGSDAITRIQNFHKPEKTVNVSNSVKLYVPDYPGSNAASPENVFSSDEWQSIELDEMGINTFQLKEDIEMENVTSTVVEPECCGDDGFLESDLVWGKVRSHPWWPGQIFHPSASSEWALEYFKSGSFLIAYFGDQTFAWNDASQLKPFRTHFSDMVNQSNLEAFLNAVDSALDEVSRRVVFGLSCSCLPEEEYKQIKSQIMVNAGIQQESSIRDGGDRFSGVASFQPMKLVKYLKDLAQFPRETDKLEFAVAQAQLLAFYHSKGYFHLPEFKMHGLLFEETVDVPIMMEREDLILSEVMEIPVSNYENDEQDPFEVTDLEAQFTSTPECNGKKESTILELFAGDNDSLGKTNGNFASLTCGTKRKAVDSMFDYSRGKNRRDETLNKQCSTIGERFCKIASQLIGTVPNLKSSADMSQTSTVYDKNNENPHKKSRRGRKRKIATLAGCHSADVWLSQLCLVAPEPLGEISFLPSMVTFFTELRNFLSHSGKLYGTMLVREPFNWTAETPELDEGLEKSLNEGSQQHEADGNIEMEGESTGEDGKSVRRRTALVLTFTDLNSVPPEANLNKIFSRYGPLEELETKVMKKSKRAKVVFKRRSDAENAFSSSGKYSIFGPSLVSYRLRY